jgi:hypothetical protein
VGVDEGEGDGGGEGDEEDEVEPLLVAQTADDEGAPTANRPLHGRLFEQRLLDGSGKRTILVLLEIIDVSGTAYRLQTGEERGDAEWWSARDFDAAERERDLEDIDQTTYHRLCRRYNSSRLERGRRRPPSSTPSPPHNHHHQHHQPTTQPNERNKRNTTGNEKQKANPQKNAHLLPTFPPLGLFARTIQTPQCPSFLPV